MSRYKLCIEYDGTDFSGWQSQLDNARTVQVEIEKALAQILQHRVVLVGSGRTDAGVHAASQVAHADLELKDLPPDRLRQALNSLLPKDIAILEFQKSSPDFHARFDAISRRYRYRIENVNHPLGRRFAWTPPCSWDDGEIQPAVELLTGRHSFKSFSLRRPNETGYFCTLTEAEWQIDEDGVSFYIAADRFMHKMVRGIVGALIDVGRGRFGFEEFRRLLERPEQNSVVSVAPPHGLTLLKVEYPDGF